MSKELEPYSEYRFVVELIFLKNYDKLHWWQFKKRRFWINWRESKLREQKQA